MAIVYLAQDLKHQRRVAVKVLRPELAAVLGRERFLREVTTTANLRHPHILPLFDSGAVGEFLFYVMPLVQGESLRDRLAREKQLPIDDVLQIAREVADALQYAHTCGVIHRDIKPANILLENGHAVVADFGIARAVTAAGDSETLTETGLGLGTPLYMSPEQSTGDRALDGRSDQYSLACVVYEMLAGKPPFIGSTPQAILAHQLTDPVPPLTTVRRSVPLQVEQVINRALSRGPADRFATTKQFADALEGRGVSAAPAHRVRRRWRGAGIAAAAAGLLALVLAGVVIRFRRPPPPPLEPSLMAVFPFRVSGTDSSYGALRDGMVDFLEVRFSGSGGARVVPARTALAAWHATIKPYGRDATEEEARAVARRLGAGGVVLGTIVAAPGHLILNGSLLETEAGRVRAEAKVEGAPDSLLSLIDQFAAQLAALSSGERADRLAGLTSTSLPALYAYLAGKASYRAGRYDAAARHFEQALGFDSTFALAAIGVGAAAGWVSVNPHEHERSMRLAWTYRDRLGPRERVFLDALAGPRYPAPPQPRERIQAWEEAVRQVPDDPDLWTRLGDAYFHDGALAEVEEPYRRAAEALDHALALDTALNVEPAIHLLQIAAMEGDTAKVRRLVSRIPEAAGSAYLRLEAGAVLGDSAMLAAARPIVDSTGSNVGQLLEDAQVFGLAIQEAERSAAVYLKRSRPNADPWPAFELFNFYQQLGRPDEAAAALARMVPEEAPASNITFVVVHAILGYVRPEVATKVLARLIPLLDDPVPRDSSAREGQYNVICIVEWWRLVHGDTRTARGAIRRLAGDGHHCGVLLEALLASAEHRADADAAFGQLDTLLLTGGGRSSWIMPVVRWREAQGDVRRALRTVRRCVRYGRMVNVANCRREEGRLAELVGDREGAIQAYSHYLALRYKPEPSVKPEVDRVRAELAELVGEPR